MEAQLQTILDGVHSTIRGEIIAIICQTLLYGIYLCLVPIAIRAMVTNRLQSRPRKWLLVIATSTFALMTIYWIFSIIFTILLVDSLNNSITTCHGSDDASICIRSKARNIGIPSIAGLAMFTSILFVNFIIADGVVVWRAWVLCSDQSKVVLMIPVVMLVINTVIYLLGIAGRIIAIISEEEVPDHLIFNFDFATSECILLTLSLLINIYATSIIALKAWKYRKLLMESGIGIRTPRQAMRILAVLVESGVIYILISITSLASIFIFQKFALGEVSGLWMLVSMQLVGMYPIVVVLLVEKKCSLSSTYSSFGTIIDIRGDRPSQAAPMTFMARPSSRQPDLATKPPCSDIHVTFNYTLEPDDIGMSVGRTKVSSEEHAVL